MTPPKPIPATAKNALKQLNKWNRLDVMAFTLIMRAAARGDIDTVMELAEAGAKRNLSALTAGIYAAAGSMSDADDEIMEHNAEEFAARKRSGN